MPAHPDNHLQKAGPSPVTRGGHQGKKGDGTEEGKGEGEERGEEEKLLRTGRAWTTLKAL